MTDLNSNLDQDSNYREEAIQLSKYLLSVSVKEKEIITYIKGMKLLQIKLTEQEQKQWQWMLKSDWRMACGDAALALQNPSSLIRRKIFTMLAILETSPNYTPYFLSKDFGFAYYFKLIFVGVRSVFRAIFGIIMLNTI